MYRHFGRELDVVDSNILIRGMGIVARAIAKHRHRRVQFMPQEPAYRQRSAVPHKQRFYAKRGLKRSLYRADFPPVVRHKKGMRQTQQLSFHVDPRLGERLYMLDEIRPHPV